MTAKMEFLLSPLVEAHRPSLPLLMAVAVLVANPTSKLGASIKVLPEWMRIKSLTGLKLLLWKAILATLVVWAIFVWFK